MKVQTVPIVTISIELTPAEAQAFLDDPTALRDELRAALKTLPAPQAETVRPKRAWRVSVAQPKQKKAATGGSLRRPLVVSRTGNVPGQKGAQRSWANNLGYTCETCGASYISEKRYQNHLRDQHQIVPEFVPSANGQSLA